MSEPDWKPSAPLGRIADRARLLARLRAFFDVRGVIEVETPLLSRHANPDPVIDSIQAGPRGWLRTSPEFAMKRLLAAGLGDCYELGRVFRAGEAGRHHNPEFTMLEWYRVGWDWRRLAGEVVDLVRAAGDGCFDDWTLDEFDYRGLFLEHAGLDPFEASDAELAEHAATLGADRSAGLGRRGCLDLLMGAMVQPALPNRGLTLVYDFPADQAALAEIRDGNPPVAERFELYLGRHELANGYQELTDAGELAARFESQRAERRDSGAPDLPADPWLLDAMRAGLPRCSGVALGVDRLLMAVTGAQHIDEVIAFPSDRA